MLYTKAMMSEDPRVLEAIPARMRRTREGLARAQAWATEMGGDGVVGSTAYGAFRIVAITATRTPSGRWRRLPGPRTPAGTFAYAPLMGSEERRAMESMSVPLMPVPGVPQWVEGKSDLGARVACTPSMFVHGGIGYCEFECEPNVGHQPSPRTRGDWTPLNLADLKSVKAAMEYDRPASRDAA